MLPSAESVDSLIQVSDSVLCAGGMDGKLRWAGNTRDLIGRIDVMHVHVARSTQMIKKIHIVVNHSA